MFNIEKCTAKRNCLDHIAPDENEIGDTSPAECALSGTPKKKGDPQPGITLLQGLIVEALTA